MLCAIYWACFSSTTHLATFELGRFGGVDVLVNNAGIQPPASCVPIHELDEAFWNQIMAVNVSSIYYMSKHVSTPHAWVQKTFTFEFLSVMLRIISYEPSVSPNTTIATYVDFVQPDIAGFAHHD